MNDDLIAELTALGERWRYEHPGGAEFSHEQQLVDGLTLLQILHRHGVPWPTELASKEIPAPGRCSSHMEARPPAGPTEWVGAAVDFEAVELLKRDPDAFFRRTRK